MCSESPKSISELVDTELAHIRDEALVRRIRELRVFLSGAHMNIGMECSWYELLEDVMRESTAWDVPGPDDYAVN